MKKLINKIRRRTDSDEESSSRITADTVAEHREKVISSGRKFKYPHQYTRRKLIMTAVTVGIIAVIVSIATGWWQLYIRQSTSDFMYHVTEVLPLPVAKVDGEFVMYRDYLMKYRSSVYYLEHVEQVSFKSDDGKSRINYIKQRSIQDAIADAYAIKLARELKLSVTDNDVSVFIKSQRQTASGEISEQTYNTVIMDHFGWSLDEYRHEIRNKLLRQKVAYSIDKDALKVASDFHTAVKSNTKTGWKELVNKNDDDTSYGVSGWVPKTNQDGGLAQAASKMTVKQISDVIKSTIGDGYYILRLVNINNNQVNYEYIKVPLTVFDMRLKQVEKSDKIDEFITIEKS